MNALKINRASATAVRAPRATRARVVLCRAEVSTEVKMVKEIDPATFYDLTENSDVPVLVDYFTQWCGPCKMIAPQVELLAGEFKGRMLMTKIDCGAHDKKFAIDQGIKALPTFRIFHKGQQIGECTGSKVDKLRAIIEEHAL
ncbi:MAG: thioredoxin-like protein [Monoraphidium minutum]|nr:MAG: thioredoxin-like protein [Monoraphidium minutum]